MKTTVTCKMCEEKFRRITALHLWTQHNTTMKQYRERYPDAPIVAEDDSTVARMSTQFQGYNK